MKKLLNTLFVTSDDAYLSREGETVVVSRNREVALRVPIHTLEGIILLSHSSLSTPLMGFCAEHRVQISCVSGRGEFYARLQGPVAGNVLLRRAQYRAADEPSQCAEASYAFVGAKVANCRTVLLRAIRDLTDIRSRVEPACDGLARTLETLQARHAAGTLTVDAVRGLEGDAAQQYFAVFDALIKAEKPAFSFTGRSRRPPLDRINALLSFVYTLLMHDIVGALESVGLDPYVGFLHTDRPGRPGLALDLMEEMRPVLADRLVLTLINRKQVGANDFEIQPNGAVLMNQSARRTVLQQWQARKQEEVTHPFLGEAVALGLFPYVQALLLSRWLRGDLDAYPALVWR
jgi:CRISPR-associated protein Cas1